MAVGNDDGVEHLVHSGALAALLHHAHGSHLPFHVRVATVTFTRQQWRRRRHGDAQDPGVEPDGVHKPERVAEVLEVAVDLAVAREAAVVTGGGAGGQELEVGDAHSLARAQQPHGRVHAAVHLHRRRRAERVAVVGGGVVQPLPADVAALLHDRHGVALAPQLARCGQAGHARADDAHILRRPERQLANHVE
uniref:Uncharacterized protein n=1 Tax=Arundo donax TaxID=35708 RepID=A0A0A9GCB8_ARUDO